MFSLILFFIIILGIGLGMLIEGMLKYIFYGILLLCALIIANLVQDIIIRKKEDGEVEAGKIWGIIATIAAGAVVYAVFASFLS